MPVISIQIVEVSGDLDTATVQLKNVLKEAKLRSQQVTIAGSRHTMGGQTIYPNGIGLDMTQFRQMQLNLSTKILTEERGASP